MGGLLGGILCLAESGLLTGAEPSATSGAARTNSAEHQMQALYVFNFTKYVEWPTEAFADTNAPFIIGLLGAGELRHPLLEITQSRNVEGHPILVRSLENEQEARTCQMVFFGSEAGPRAAQVLQALQSAPVLTVGEMEDFLAAGGMIRLGRQENRTRLEINLEAARRARLVLSARLLAVAEVVKGRPASWKN